MQPGRATLRQSSEFPSDSNAGELNFGSFGQAGTVQKYIMQQGEDASYTVDGASLTDSSNTVTNAISGVTLNLLGADKNTTLTVNVAPDTPEIETMLTACLTRITPSSHT